MGKSDYDKIWVLVDKNIGSANQAISLADQLQTAYKIKNIEYNLFTRLPNYILAKWPLHLKKSVLNDLLSTPLPQVIISAGRKAAVVALHLKKLSDNKLKIIQILRPDIEPSNFDLIILPQHDSFNYSTPNVIKIIGSLNNIQNKLHVPKNNAENEHLNIDKFIAVIIGGSTRRCKFSYKNGKIFADIITQIAEIHCLPLFITFSRRTPDKIKRLFRKNFLADYTQDNKNKVNKNIIYDPVSGTPNPYPHIVLGKAEYIITTVDSISICSEAASTGKPVYVFTPDNFSSKKHRFFLQQLVDLGIVRRLKSNTIFLEKYEYRPLSEFNKLREIVWEKIGTLE